MNTMIRPLAAHQTGSVLVLSLLILLVMTIAGVAAMRGGLMQERMSGNVNLQTLAFQAASAGINEALDFGMQEWASEGGCPNATGEWEGDPSTPRNIPLAANSLQQGIVVRYVLRTDCLELPRLTDLVDGTVSTPVFQAYVTSLGEVRQGNTLLAAREIEIRIGTFREDGMSAMHIEGTPEVIFSAGNSNSFIMDGKGGPAISASNSTNSTIISDDIASRNRLQNFIGGVGTSTYPMPFRDAAELARFVLRIKAYMQHRGINQNLNTQGWCGDDPNTNTTVPLRYVTGNFPVGSNTDLEGITYVTGNVTMSGNPSGSGLLIVEGSVQWRGTADFQGILIALGGQFSISGGGRGRTEGTMFITNLNLGAIETVGAEVTNPADHYFGKFQTNTGLSYDRNPTDPSIEYLGNISNFISDNAGGRHWFDKPDPGPDDSDWLLGIASRLEIISGDMPIYDPVNSGLAPQTYRGLAYHGLYADCTANDWLTTDADGNLVRSTCATNDGFGASTVNFDGGGNHRMDYGCEMVNSTMQILNQCLLSEPTASPTDPTAPECDTNDPTGPCFCDPDDPQLRKNCYRLAHPWAPINCNAAPQDRKDEAAISWRENIGWREQLTSP